MQESREETIKHLQYLISDYEENIIPKLQKDIENPKTSDFKKQAFKILLNISENELEGCRQDLKEFLINGEIKLNLDDGKQIAKWQKQAHPNQKSPPYREWKKKYGDKFTKPEYKEVK